MSANAAEISVWSNNPSLENIFHGHVENASSKFREYKTGTSSPYVLLLIDLSSDLNHISHKLIDIYDRCRNQKQKLCVTLLHGKVIDIEKNIYFEQLLSNIGKEEPIHRLVIVKDLLQSRLLIQGSWLEEYILRALVERKIVISRKGENEFFPLSIKDFIEGIQKVFFLSGTRGKLFWLTGDRITDLELAYIIKKNLEDADGPEFEIDASGEDIKTPVDIVSLGIQTRALLGWEPIDDFTRIVKESVQKLLEDQSLLLSSLHRSQEKDKPLEKISSRIQKLFRQVSKFKKKGIKKSVETGPQVVKKFAEDVFGLGILTFLILTVSFILSTALAFESLEEALSSSRNGDINLSVKQVGRSIFYSKIGESSYSFVSPVISLVAKNFHEKNHNTFVFLRYSQSSLSNLQQTYQLAEKILDSINNTNIDLDYKDTSLALRSNLSLVYENINQIKLLSRSGKLPKVLEEKLQKSEEFINLSKIEKQITQLIKTAELIPTILAGENAKNIVLVLQNSHELRSTGGVIENFLVLVVDKGRVISQNMYTSEEVDQLAVGEIPAPPLIERFTGSKDWKTQDLNYNPDFLQTAENLSWYIDKTLKFTPDIIIGINDHLITDFLDEEKGIVFKGQSITSESFTNSLSGVDGSVLFAELTEHYLTRIFEGEIGLVPLGRILAKQSMENNLLLWTREEDIEQSIVQQSFSGAIYPHSCHSGLSGSRTCLSQTTYLNESRFSLSRMSVFTRDITHEILLESQKVVHEYRIIYSPETNSPVLEVDLNLILQLYAPENSVLEYATVDDEITPRSQIDSQMDKNLLRYQIPATISYGKEHSIVIRFTTPLAEPLFLPFAYSLTEYRQPGLKNEETKLLVHYPETARPAAITSEVQTGPNMFTYTFPPKTSTFGVDFVVNNP